MEKRLNKILISLSFVSLIPFIVNAQTGTLEKILITVKNFLFNLASIIAIIFIIIGGYQMITASGDPKKFETGKTTLLYAAIGLIVILIAEYIVDWIKTLTK